jgi:hypothetical protein
MLILPVQTPDHKDDALIVVLGPDNLERMKEGDPAEVQLSQIRGAGKDLVDPAILLCYEEPSPALNQLIQRGNLSAILKHLQRGWKFRPQAGDHDRGPERLGGPQ